MIYVVLTSNRVMLHVDVVRWVEVELC